MIMRVSIVITNYNYAAYLPAAIESALAQQHDNVEIVVVDDGSSDDSREVIARYSAAVTPVLKQNGGQGSAVNAGFAACSGDAVLFLDADDELLPKAAATIARLFADPGVAKAHWPLQVIDPSGRATGHLWPHGDLPQGDLRQRLVASPDYLTPPQSGNAFARWMLEEVLPMPEADFLTGADTYLFLLAPAFGEVRRSREPLGRYRRHTENNYSGLPFDDRMTELRRWFDVTLRALAAVCEGRGIAADPAAWRRNGWVYRVTKAARQLDELIPPRTPFVLVDDGDWSMLPDERRRPIPFLERNGEFWGPPSDDAEAIAELERLRTAGASYLVFGFPAFWWLDYYAGFADHVAGSFERVAETKDLLAYDLSGLT